ncbi:hypothetical protein [Salipaludibacillus sp. CF4.18]|uniref:hypothetical protein n=1 Tax=Salipaludibacillus sp. CF4.18 TaxID=3373081 RepID=UPI003EE74FA3
MEHTFYKGITIAMATILLSGCFTSPLERELEEVKQKELDKQKQEHPNVEYAESLKQNKSIEQLLDEEEKEDFDDPEEFSHFLSEVLLDFRMVEITPDELITFMQSFGSEEYVEDIENNHVSTQLFREIQDHYEANTLNLIEQKISVLHFNEQHDEATFFRQITSYHSDPEYYQTNIILEDDVWKFDDNRETVNKQFTESYTSEEEAGDTYE